MIPIQYQNSKTLCMLVNFIYQHYDTQSVIDNFYDVVFNLYTAKGFGLDIWGRIVGVGRYLNVRPQNKYFGFDTPNDSFTPFNVAPFRNGEPETSTYRLSDDAYRKLILVKAMANIVRPNAPTINRMLQYLFDKRRCYVLDLGDMAMRYVFAFYLQPYERAIIESEYFPRPAGVRVEILEIPEPNIFGFHEGGASFAPFNQGTFYNGQ